MDASDKNGSKTYILILIWMILITLLYLLLYFPLENDLIPAGNTFMNGLILLREEILSFFS